MEYPTIFKSLYWRETNYCVFYMFCDDQLRPELSP